MAMTRYRRADLLRWAALGACRVTFSGSELVFERPGYVHPITALRASLTDEQRAELSVQAFELDAQLLAQRPPWPELMPAERRAELEERERLRWSCYSDIERAAMRLRARRDLVRYGLRRLRSGNEWRWQRPLATVRAETVGALRELGHPRLARMVEDVAAGEPVACAVQPEEQMELGL